MFEFPEYRPDVSAFSVKSTGSYINVLPQADGYGPFPSFSILSSALPAVCRGYFYARNSDGSVTIFAGTANRLYRLSNTDFSWGDVSKGAVAYPGLPSQDHWNFVQFGSVVIAVQPNVVPQAFTLGSSSTFDDLGGSPPQARYVAVVGTFLVLSGLLDNPFRIHWSGQNAITTWTVGTNQSDIQDFADGGIVRGVAGGEFGLIFQDAAIRRMTYAPGSPVIFQIDRITSEKGLFAPMSLIRTDEMVFFCAADGFHKIAPGGYPEPIGFEKVDTTFFADVDTNALQLFIGAGDPRASRVYWAYKSLSGAGGLFDKLLCYDWLLDRWSPATLSGEYISTLSRPGITLEGMDALGPIDDMAFSLDDVASNSPVQLSAVDSSHRLGFYNGDALEATLQTAEFAVADKRVMVTGFRVISNAPTVHGLLRHRATLSAASGTTSETQMNAHGICPQRKDTRYVTARIRIPAATVWNYATGVEPTYIESGMR